MKSSAAPHCGAACGTYKLDSGVVNKPCCVRGEVTSGMGRWGMVRRHLLGSPILDFPKMEVFVEENGAVEFSLEVVPKGGG